MVMHMHIKLIKTFGNWLIVNTTVRIFSTSSKHTFIPGFNCWVFPLSVFVFTDFLKTAIVLLLRLMLVDYNNL